VFRPKAAGYKSLKRSYWKDTAELIGIAAIVGSLIFVGLQIRQEQNVAVSQIYQTTLAAEVEIYIALAQHAETLAKTHNVNDLSDAERIAVEELTDMFSARAFFEAQSAQRIDDGDWSGPVNAFAYFLHEHPGVQRLWIERIVKKQNFYSRFDQGAQFIEFNDLVRSKLDSMQE